MEKPKVVVLEKGNIIPVLGDTAMINVLTLEKMVIVKERGRKQTATIMIMLEDDHGKFHMLQATGAELRQLADLAHDHYECTQPCCK